MAASPTDGFTQVAFTYAIQKPYNLDVSERYSFTNGVHDFWVYTTDLPHTPDSQTLPRTELRVQGHDYTSGVWQFEGDFYVASSTTGVCIMQVFGGPTGSATALQLRIINKNLVRYGGGVSSATVATSITDRWVHLNVIHDANVGTIKIYIDMSLEISENNTSDQNHYFKCGVYTQSNPSSCMESKWKNIILWKKNA